ncbi:MAG: AIR synthase-related protein [Promethearchaeota archaeon]
MIHRIKVGSKHGEKDVLGENTKKEIENFFHFNIDSVVARKVYSIDTNLSEKELDLLKRDLFIDEITECLCEEDTFDWLIEVGYKPGVTDNVGNTSKNVAIPAILARELQEDESVWTSTQYLINGKDLTKKDVEKIGIKLLANPVIEDIKIVSYDEMKKAGLEFTPPVIKGKQDININAYNLNVSDEKLTKISIEGVLALSLEEMKTIKDYFKKDDVIAERKRIGMDKVFWDKPTDAELECLAQTWSEHCKHKIFNAIIRYKEEETEEIEKKAIIDSLFDTYIKNPSNEIGDELGWVASSFHDNAGAVKFNDRILVVDKIETHNSPSALEPYGGAITGIVGVNRDPMGTGKGAKLMFNIFGYCFGSPYTKGVPEDVLHPKRIRNGVHKGVIDGGNQSGIPLVSGWEFFDERYTFRPIVYCGTIGVMPVEINGDPSHLKKADHGDAIIMVGGRVGKDGIHGATFSSAELDKESPVQAVQIGDPITQKKMSDFLLGARDLGLYKCITDNGAGGLSSSVGEMARYCNGCKFDLEKVPLKYQGLDPWEILVSESQERMTVAVEPDKVEQFLELSEKRGVESTVLGYFENSGRFHVTYDDKTVAYLDMEFLHDGLPKMELDAVWKRPTYEEPEFEQPEDMNETLEELLKSLNICSKEKKLRQYDHEVKGLSVIKLLVGEECDVPSDATVSFLEYGSMEGLAVAEGKNPHYSEIDTYHMTASIIDEAIRRIIAIGGKLPSKDTVFYGLDNFCWNISTLNSEDGRYKLAQLVRANKALVDYCKAFKIPCISGKDSMKNVWKLREIVNGNEVERIISIPPTLMFSARAKIDDVRKTVTMDVKKPGDLVYIVGLTLDELGGSEYYSYMGEKLRGERFIGNNVPKVDAESAKKIYRSISEATEKELLHSVHTPTIGGLGVALAKSAFAGGYGMELDLRKVPYEGKKRDDYILFSQSNSRFIVTISPEKKEEFERIMRDSMYSQLGIVTQDRILKIKGLDGNFLIDSDLDYLKKAWKSTLGD